ncbi:hypothetical protein [Flavobacterium notoginsengisoli]|uniref:hypothetical protein n=1 Tax=Flavobacterium notoginsengisoli TaxID=1478199 RepID=UPI003638BC4E
MEVRDQTLTNLKFREVYIFDMLALQDIYYQNLHKNNSKNLSFGIPFLLAQRGKKINSFASLVLDQDNRVSFMIFDDVTLSAEDKNEFTNTISNFLKKKRNDNFKDPEQFNKSSNYLAKWLDL